MTEIRTEDAVGQVLCHDITQIIRGVTKDARFRKGHIITEEDIPVLLSLGKDHIYIWEHNENMLHEDEAAEILRQMCQNDGMEASDTKEGKIELRALYDGVFHVDEERFDAVNELDDMTIATIPQHMPVKAGTKLAGMRVIPLVISKEKMDQARKAAGDKPLMELRPYKKMRIGVVTTGNEVFHGRIEDTFTPVIEAKLNSFGMRIDEHRISDDVLENTRRNIQELLDLGMDMVICTGGMSVDPDDRTPGAISSTGSRVVTYGTPVLPGAMFMLAYYEKNGSSIPILGLPGCVMYCPATIFDIVLPRLLTGEELKRKELRHLGIGGLCMECAKHGGVCRYPICGFGK